MVRDWVIEIGRGVGPLTFGMSKKAVLSLLGEPSYKIEDTGGLVYSKLGVLCGFDAQSGRLTGIEVDPSHDFRLHGSNLPIELSALMQALRPFGVHLSAEDSTRSCYIDDEKGVMVFVEDGQVDAVVFGVQFDKDGDNIVWPSTQEA
ncbi:MAG: hypothetical protein AAF735_07690 [Myxococcota bacterium]